MTTTPDSSQAFHDASHSLFHALLPLWPLAAIIGVIVVAKALVELWKLRRLTRAGIFEIDRMSGHEFERKLALMFRSLGYRAKVVGASGGDFGGDLVIQKNGTKTVVQAKCWKNNVGLKAVQEVFSAKAMYGADSAMVVTNARFTNQARVLAATTQVELWGRDELVAALLKGRKAKVSPATEEAATGVVERLPAVAASSSGAFCARCGERVSVKVRDYCFANSPRFAGLVYCFEHQRGFKRR